MTSAYLLHLIILSGIIGIQSQVITVSRVSVKTGASISIPCLYKQWFRNNVKYLCKGSNFFPCTTVVRTDQPGSHLGKFSIDDDKKQRIFTVSIHNLTNEDSHKYWCAIKKVSFDVKQYFHLSVNTGLSNLYVNQQEVEAFVGGCVNVQCRYEIAGATKWCKLDGKCVTELDNTINGTPVNIINAPGVLNVTMSELKTESSGWYWCSVGDLQMPVHITVHQSTSTTTTTTTTLSPSTTRNQSTTLQYSSTVTNTELHTTHPTNFTTVTGGNNLQNKHKSVSAVLVSVIICVTLVIFILMVIFIWFTLKKTKATSQTIKEVKDEPTYCNTEHAKGNSIELSQDVGDVDVMYSSVVTKKKRNAQRVEVTDESVTYSTVVFKH